MDRTQVIRVNNDLLLDKILQDNIVPLQLSCRLIMKRDRLSSSDAIRSGSERSWEGNEETDVVKVTTILRRQQVRRSEVFFDL